MFIIVLIGMPFVLTYTVAVYWTFRGRVELGRAQLLTRSIVPLQVVNQSLPRRCWRAAYPPAPSCRSTRADFLSIST